MGSHCGRNTGRFRGLTVADTVVVVVVLVFLVGLLMPALAGTQNQAARDRCNSNLKGMGKAMLLYANDYDDEFPRAGGRNPAWSPVVWGASTRRMAYAITSTDGTGGNATISSCFYLLVKYAEVMPKTFLCPEDPNVSEFALAAETTKPGEITELTQAWDFGSNPQTHCSYAYCVPWGRYVLTTSSEPGLPMVADRNPYIPSPGQKVARTFVDPNNPAIVFAGKAGSEASQKYGNSTVHKGEGQNVLFLDTHVSFQNRPFCGLEDDNIYTISRNVDKGDTLGMIPGTTAPGATPKNRKDSVLVHDPPTWPTPVAQR